MSSRRAHDERHVLVRSSHIDNNSSSTAAAAVAAVAALWPSVISADSLRKMRILLAVAATDKQRSQYKAQFPKRRYRNGGKSQLASSASPLICTKLEHPCSFASAHEMATAVEGSLRLAIDVVNVESSDASDNEYVTPTSTAGFHTPLASSPFFEMSPCSSPLQLRASVSPLKRSLSSAEQLQEPA
eukprot:6511-Heterococcus_DN1.PRE.2